MAIRMPVSLFSSRATEESIGCILHGSQKCGSATLVVTRAMGSESAASYGVLNHGMTSVSLGAYLGEYLT
jgi:hypothetical protein